MSLQLSTNMWSLVTSGSPAVASNIGTFIVPVATIRGRAAGPGVCQDPLRTEGTGPPSRSCGFPEHTILLGCYVSPARVAEIEDSGGLAPIEWLRQISIELSVRVIGEGDPEVGSPDLGMSMMLAVDRDMGTGHHRGTPSTSLDTLNAAAKASGSSARTIRLLPVIRTINTPWRAPRTHIRELDRTARASLDQSRTGVTERISDRLIRLRGQPGRKARRSSVKVTVTVIFIPTNQSTKNVNNVNQELKSAAVSAE